MLDILIDEVDKVMPKHEATPTCLTWDGWYLGISDCRSDVLFLLSSCLVSYVLSSCLVSYFLAA